MKTSIDFVGSEAFELPSVWVTYSFRVLILTIFLLLRIELGALFVGVVSSAAHRGTRLSHPPSGPILLDRPSSRCRAATG